MWQKKDGIKGNQHQKRNTKHLSSLSKQGFRERSSATKPSSPIANITSAWWPATLGGGAATGVVQKCSDSIFLKDLYIHLWAKPEYDFGFLRKRSKRLRSMIQKTKKKHKRLPQLFTVSDMTVRARCCWNRSNLEPFPSSLSNRWCLDSCLDLSSVFLPFSLIWDCLFSKC